MKKEIKNNIGLILFFTFLFFFYVPCAQARLSVEKVESIIEEYNNQVPLEINSTLPIFLRGACYQPESYRYMMESMEVFLYPKDGHMLFFAVLIYGEPRYKTYTLDEAENKFIRSEDLKNETKRIGAQTEKGGMEWRLGTEEIIFDYELFQDIDGNIFMKYDRVGEPTTKEHSFCEFVEYVEYVDFSTELN